MNLTQKEASVMIALLSCTEHKAL